METLENRQLLTNLTVTVPATVTINEESTVAPYAVDSAGPGTIVTSVVVGETNAPPAAYTKGNLVITSGNSSNALGNAFAVDAFDNIVINNPSLIDFENHPTYTLTLTATDNANNTGTATVTINLNNVDDAPIIPQYLKTDIPNVPDGTANALQINENSFNGTVVGTVQALDQDPGQQSTLTYQFVGTVPGINASTPAFTIDPFTGTIRVLDSSFLDYETRRNGSGVGNLGEGNLFGYPDVVFAVKVRATDVQGLYSQVDNGGGPTDTTIYIRLRDVGEIPPDVTNSTKSLSVNENSTVGTSLGFFQLKDGTPNFTSTPVRMAAKGLDTFEPQQRHSFSIVGGNVDNAFAIDPDTGEVTIANPVVNFESLNQYNLQIQVTDNNPDAVALGAVQNVAPLSTVATLHIIVNDINEPTAIPAGQSFTIPENTLNGTVVGTVIANDPDTQQPNGQGSLTYSIISGNSVKVGGTTYSSLFSIDPNTGTISVNNTTGLANNVALNYENQTDFALTIRVEDRSNLATSANQTVAIKLSNVNEQAPSVQTGSATIAENRPLNTFVGQVLAAAGESGNTITSFQITGGNTNNAFAIDSLGRITVNNPAAINFEQNKQFVLTIKATDNGTPPLFATGTFTVNVTNLNEQIVMLDQLFGVNENTPNGTIIGQIVTTDPDNEVTNTQGTSFQINGGNTGGAFSIDAQGRIIVADASQLNFEVNPSFSLVVTVTDTGATAVPSSSAAATMTISLTNINDAPVMTAQTLNVAEHSLPGTVVGTVVATDEDLPKQQLTFAITGGNTNNAFTIDSTTGVLKVTDPHLIDYATTPVFNLTVQVTDNGSPSLSSSAAVKVNLLDVSEPHLAGQTVALTERSANGTIVANASSGVSGGVPGYKYSIVGGNTGNAFAINPNTGAITVNDSTAINYDNIQTFALKVLVQDSQATPLGDTATITVNLINIIDPPQLILIESTPLSYVENVSPPATPTNNNNATPISGTITVSDHDSGTITKATVKITGNYQSGEDRLLFTNTATITGIFDPASGTLTLTGSDTLAHYTQALQSVLYKNISDAPNTLLPRTITFTVFDNSAPALSSNLVTRNINVSAANDPPALASLEGTPLNYIEKQTTAITSALTVTDPDSGNLQGATITISDHYVLGQDQLSFTNIGTITGNWDPATGKLTLSGVDTLAHYQSALQSIKYTNLSNNPDLTPRKVSFSITDDSGLSSPLPDVARTITITPVNDPPVLSGLESTDISYIEKSTNTLITQSILATDVDSNNAIKAVIQISGNYKSDQDQLAFTNTGTIAGSWNPVNGTLTLSGADTFDNYTTALRSIRYINTSLNPSTQNNRTISFQIFDSANLGSTQVTRDVHVTAVNDPPALSGIESSPLDYIENVTPPATPTNNNNVTPITSGITADDVDSANLSGATIWFSGGYVNGEDNLVFTNIGNITGVWNAGTGSLTLTGTDTLANYNLALRSVSYTNLSDTPTAAARTVSYQVRDDGALSSNRVARILTVTPANDPPALSSIDTSTLAYIENATPPATPTNNNNITPISPNIVVIDDSQNLSGATITITAGYTPGEDKLVFANLGAITGTWNSGSGTLSLTGSDTVAHYIAALSSVSYTNLSDSPTTGLRTIKFQVTDNGALLSNSFSRSLTVTPANDPPALSSIESSPLLYKQHSTNPPAAENDKTQITGVIQVSDPDSTMIQSAKVAITTNFTSGEDVLLYSSPINKISGSYDPATGILTLSGLDTLANYQAALQSIKYQDTAIHPKTLTRTVTFTVVDDQGATSPSVSRDIQVTSTGNAPVLTLGAADQTPLNYTENNTTQISTTIAASDPDGDNLKSATVQMSTNYKPEDQLVFTDTPRITGSWNPATGILTLTGVDTPANYTAALQSVKYVDNSDTPNTAPRTISFTAVDATGLISQTVSRDVSITPANDPPTLSNIEASSLNYIENAVPPATPSNNNNVTPITATLQVNDPDSVQLKSATIQIWQNYQPTEDRLIYPPFTNKINYSWDAATGTLTLTGLDTAANYQKAIQSVKYQNLSDSPNTLTRQIRIQAFDDAGAPSAFTTRDIVITPSDDPPSIAVTASGPLLYVEKTATAVILDAATTLTIIDPDVTDPTSPTQLIFSATVSMSNAVPGEDSLNFVDTAKIHHSVSTVTVNGITTMTVTLTGLDTFANYADALKSVTYSNSSSNPHVDKARIVTFGLTDALANGSAGLSNINSIPAQREIDVIAVNDPPTLNITNTSVLQYVDHAPGGTVNAIIPIAPSLGLTDPDSSNITGAIIQFAPGTYVAGQDVLSLAGPLNPKITASWDATTGTLTLTGKDTLSNYLLALKNVSYQNTSLNPNTAIVRTVSFQVTDDGNTQSNSVSRSIQVNHNNSAPVLTNLESSVLNYTEDVNSFVSIPVTQTLTVSDADSTSLSGATVTIGSFFAGEDSLSFTPIGNITGSFAGGVLTLSGTDSAANYTAALQSVTYQNLSHGPHAGTRTLIFSVTDDQNVAGSATRSLKITATNNAPSVTPSATTLTYGPGSGFVPILNQPIAITDPDNTTLRSVTVVVTGFNPAIDRLTFTNTSKVVALFLGDTLVLTPSGTTTFADWETALQNAQFWSVDPSTSSTQRIATFTLNDGSAVNPSTTLTTTITVKAIIAPVLTGTSNPTYTENNPASPTPIPVNPTISVANTSVPTLASAIVQFTGGTYRAGQDKLSFVNNDPSTFGNITAAFFNGALTLTSAGSTATNAQWQAALQAVSYSNTSFTPDLTPRTISFQVNTGLVVNPLSNIVSSTITITKVNFNSTVTNNDTTTLSYTEAAASTPVFPNLSVTDPDSTNLSGAVIQIIAGYNDHGSLDKLTFTNTPKITSSFDVSTGTLTLTGNATVAEYQAALRSIGFFNQFDEATTLDRTIQLYVIDSTNLSSNMVTRTVSITTVNNVPQLFPLESTPVSYKYNDPFAPAPIITNAAAVYDPDSPTMSSAVVSISANYNVNRERLNAVTAGTALTASWNASTGKLTITGNDTLANYNKVLDSVTYVFLSAPVSTAARTISFQVFDDKNAASNVVSRNLEYVNTNQPPTVNMNSGPIAFKQGQGAIKLAQNISIADPDSTIIQSATIKITGNYQLNGDRLVFSTIGKIKGVFQPTTATLTLTGADTLANYQAALRTILFNNSSASPGSATRTVTITVNDGLSSSSPVMQSITFTVANKAPVVATNVTTALPYSTKTGGQIAIAPNLTVTDDGTTLSGATVKIGTNYQQGRDFLGWGNIGNIVGTYNQQTGVLTFTGVDTVANYQFALRNVIFQYLGSVASTINKSISFQVSDGLLNSGLSSRTVSVTK